MGLLVTWNLRLGFDDYLQARETHRLTRFKERLQTLLESRNFSESVQWQRTLNEALRDFGSSEWRGSAVAAAQPHVRPSVKQEGTTGVPSHLPGGPEGFGGRMSLYSPDGVFMAGRLISTGVPYFESPVIHKGQLVALARLRKPQAVPDAVDASFIARQYLGIGVAAVLLVLVAGVLGHFAATRWVGPLLLVQRSTTQIATGQKFAPLDETRSDEIGDLMRDVNSMAISLQKLEAARRRWVAEISHELRTPLTVLRGEIEALTDGVRPLTLTAVKSLREEVLRLSRLVDDLHTLAMSDLSALNCQPSVADPWMVVQAAHGRAAVRATQRGHELTVSLSPYISGCRAVWDSQRIGQLLDNLLNNSIQHTLAPGHISLTLRIDNNEAALTIEDSAPSATTENLQQIFEPLFRADPARSGEGSGLGLAIAKAIVDAHGGRIDASLSQLGGLRMNVVLPLLAFGKSCEQVT